MIDGISLVGLRNHTFNGLKLNLITCAMMVERFVTSSSRMCVLGVKLHVSNNTN